jgi:hypothetical protein
VKKFIIFAIVGLALWNWGSAASDEAFTSSVKVDTWVGEYKCGNPLNTNGAIELKSNGSFRAWSSGCWGPYSLVMGSWEDCETEISFAVESSDGDFFVAPTRALKVARLDGVLLVPVEWKDKFKKEGPNYENCFRRNEPYSPSYGDKAAKGLKEWIEKHGPLPNKLAQKNKQKELEKERRDSLEGLGIE